MKKYYAIITLALAGSLCSPRALAQQSHKEKMKEMHEAMKDSVHNEMRTMTQAPIHHFYACMGMDAGILSTATMQRPGFDDGLGTVRFSYVLNIGTTFNYNFSNHFGLLSGVNIKNIGFIEKQGDSTVKHRVYTIGVPLGIKFGNMNGTYGFIGVGADVPFNYREKGFVNRDDKQKFSEWFSDRTPAVMTNVFAGVAIKPGMTLKLQYYFNNFMNPDYTDNMGMQPYVGYNVHLIMLSAGANIPHGKHMHHHMMEEMKKHKAEMDSKG